MTSHENSGKIQPKPFGLGFETQRAIEVVGTIECMTFVRQELDLVAPRNGSIGEDTLDEHAADARSPLRCSHDDRLDEPLGRHS